MSRMGHPCNACSDESAPASCPAFWSAVVWEKKGERLMPKGSLAKLQMQFHNFSFSFLFWLPTGSHNFYNSSSNNIPRLLGYPLNSCLGSWTPILLFRMLQLSSGTSITHTFAIFLHPILIIVIPSIQSIQSISSI